MKAACLIARRPFPRAPLGTQGSEVTCLLGSEPVDAESGQVAKLAQDNEHRAAIVIQKKMRQTIPSPRLAAAGTWPRPDLSCPNPETLG